MKEKDLIIQELQQYSPLLVGLQKINPYLVPQGYFDSFSDHLMAILKSDFSIQNKNNPYLVPDTYFESFADTVLQKVKSESSETVNELAAVAPSLIELQKENVYRAPEGYFEQLHKKITRHIPQSAKVVSFHIARKWITYAAAAVFAGVMISGAFLFTYSKNAVDFNNEVGKISDEELQSYIDNNPHAVALSEEMILSNEGLTPDENHLRAISDEELQQYLNENAESEKKEDKQGS